MNAKESLDLKRLVNESQCEDNTENIRKLKHSVLIRNDIRKLEELKQKNDYLKTHDAEQFRELCLKECPFLFSNYTDIFNKTVKDELDLKIMTKLLIVLKLIEDEAIAHAEFHTPAQVANKVRSCIAMFAPDQFEAAVVEEKSTRRVSCYPNANGMATIVAFLPAADAQTIMLAIDRLAYRTNGVAKEKLRAFQEKNGHRMRANAQSAYPSTSQSSSTSDAVDFNLTDFSADLMDPMDAHRADAMTAIASLFLETNEDQVMNHGRPITVNLTIDLPTLLGLSENPGQLSGYGAIPAAVARELAADGKWRKFITDPTTGNLLDFGRESYLPPQALRDFLLARDKTCRFPGCRRSGVKGEIDHAIPWEEGGETSRSNLGVLCKRHHQLKTHGGWKLESFEDGSCEWTSPLGKKRFVPARPMDEVA